MTQVTKLFVDDVREPWSDSWVVARNADDAIDLICKNTSTLKQLSIDHDLGGKLTGYDILNVLCDMINHGYIEKLNLIIIHTMNVPALKKMMQAAEYCAHRVIRVVVEVNSED